MRLWLMCLSLAAAAFAQPAAAPRKARIAGRVLKWNGEPLRHATVTLLGPAIYSLNADADGAFAFDGLAPGSYSLIARRVGYGSQKYGASTPLARYCPDVDSVNYQFTRATSGQDPIDVIQPCIMHAPGTMLSLAGNTQMNGLAIRLAQHGLITGKVTNQDSEPVAARVDALVRDLATGGLRIESSASTGPDGEYTADDLPRGRYYLRATVSRTMSMVVDRQNKPSHDADATTYYPSKLEDSEAETVEVKAGEETGGADILMRRGSVFSVRGKVAGLPGGSQGRYAATLIQKAPLAGSSTGNITILVSNIAFLGADGTFEFRDIAPGPYVLSTTLSTRGSDGATQLLFGRQDVVVAAADVDGLNVTLVPGAPVSGTIKLEGGEPAGWPRVMLVSTDAPSRGNSATADAAGVLKFTGGVPPAEYRVRFSSLPPGMYVKSIRYGNQDGLHGTLDLTGGAAGSLDIVLSAKVAAITGKARNAKDEAAPGVSVTAWPRKAEATGGVHSASTDQNGNFEVADLGPGDYFVAAWEDIDPGLAESPEFLARFQNQAAAATLEEGGHASADVKLISRERVEAEVAKLP